MLKDKFIDIFGINPKITGTMQVIIFDKFFKCVYRLRNIPKEWNFRDVACVLELTHNANEYEAFRLDDSAEFCIDEYVYKDGKLQLTDSKCN